MSSSLPEDPCLRETDAGDVLGLTFKPLDEVGDIDRVRHASAGAICSFVGTTRDTFEGKTVTMLEYEAYASMALKTMSSIVDEARQLSLSGAFSSPWPDYPSLPSLSNSSSSTPCPPKPDLIQQNIPVSSLRASVSLVKISVIHRLGVVGAKESSISICVSSPHRREGFRACEWILEEVKKRVEIWKREVYENRDEEGIDSAWKENFPNR
ncbi:MAG: Molybdopterin synthase catalytic subunit [Cyphobasidiales sp. Tagirdzhanova-0007]|nr:MAG: Molybdopterin synthase catalytic subunit [Cyphobasidiales sp. Tagirdzhanova-0007]